MYSSIPYGIVGHSALLELLFVVFFITIFYPKLAIERIVKYTVAVFIFVMTFNWLGVDFGSRLLETIWLFVF